MNGNQIDTMESRKIEKLHDFIRSNIGDMKELSIQDITNLTAPGENYWSDMLKVDLELKNRETEALEHISLCVKCVVADNFQADLNVGMFKCEIQFYKSGIPTLQKFLKGKGVSEMPFFPPLFGARLNLEDAGEVDKNALLILKNLKTEGYQNLDRHKGFDFETALIVLKDLAVFHAVPLALKLEDPKTFKEVLASNAMVFKPPPPKDGKFQEPEAFPFDILRSILKTDLFCRSNIAIFDKMLEVEKEKFANGTVFQTRYEGPFSTLVHKDMWINNTMQMIKEGKTVKNLFLDFQMLSIDNPATDLLFLLLTSVDLTVLQNHFDYLLTVYHEKFIKTLEDIGINTKPFAYKHFLQALRAAAKEKFFHANLMNVRVIYAKKGVKSDFNKSKELQSSDIHPIAKAKLCFFFKQMVKRDWYHNS